MVPSFLTNQKMSFCKKLESITGTVQGTSREKLYKELGLETLIARRWLEKLCCFYKIKNNGILSYLAESIPSESHLYNIRNTRNYYNVFLQD